MRTIASPRNRYNIYIYIINYNVNWCCIKSSFFTRCFWFSQRKIRNINYLTIRQFHSLLTSDVDPHWSYADPDPQNLVNADPGQIQDKKSLKLFRTIKSRKKNILNLYFILAPLILYPRIRIRNAPHLLFGTPELFRTPWTIWDPPDLFGNPWTIWNLWDSLGNPGTHLGPPWPFGTSGTHLEPPGSILDPMD